MSVMDGVHQLCRAALPEHHQCFALLMTVSVLLLLDLLHAAAAAAMTITRQKDVSKQRVCVRVCYNWIVINVRD